MYRNAQVAALIASTLAVVGCGAEQNPDAPSPGEATQKQVTSVSPGSPDGSAFGSRPAAQSPAPARREDSLPAFDPKNSSFVVEGDRVSLRDGLWAGEAAPGSASKTVVRYTGPEARGDLNRDGREDLAYFVTRQGDGSGTFYYVVVAMNEKDGYRNTNAFLVGDRIRPESLTIQANELHVNFVGRDPSEPLTAAPSKKNVLLLKVSARGVLEGLMK